MQLKRNEEINQLKYETLNEIRKFSQIDGTKKKRKHSKVKSIEKETEEESSILVNSFFFQRTTTCIRASSNRATTTEKPSKREQKTRRSRCHGSD